MWKKDRGLGNFKFIGIKKSEAEELQGKIGLAKQTLITENMRRNINEVTTKFYRDKGFQNITVRIEEKPDPAFANSNAMTIYVDKGKKVRIDEVNFFENEKVTGSEVEKANEGHQGNEQVHFISLQNIKALMEQLKDPALKNT